MNKFCIILDSFPHEGMLTFNLPVILAKPEPLVSAPAVLCPLSEQRPETSWLPGIYMMCEQKYTLPLEYGVIFAGTEQLLL